MAYTQEQIATALKSSARRWSFRHEIINQDGDFMGVANVVDASVSNNDLADKVKRTGDFTLSVDNDIDYYKDRLRSFARLKMHDGNWHEWCVGTFHLTTSGKTWKMTKVPQYDGSGFIGLQSVPAIEVIDVEAYDSLIVLDEDKVLDRYVVTSGTNYRDAVVTVLNTSGFTTHMIASTGLTLPAAREWEPGTPKLKIINDLLSAINYRPLIMDPYGVPTASPYQAPENAPPVWEYKVDRESVILPGVDVELDLFNVPNAWVISVSEPDRPVLTASKINDDPNSVLSTVNRGRMIVEVVTPDSRDRDDEGNIEAATQEILEEKLERIAQEASQQYAIADFSTGLMPFHGSGDVCLIDYGEGLFRFREHEWKMELKAGGSMAHKFRRVVVL